MASAWPPEFFAFVFGVFSPDWRVIVYNFIIITKNIMGNSEAVGVASTFLKLVATIFQLHSFKIYA